MTSQPSAPPAPGNVHTIDCQYLAPLAASAYLVIEETDQGRRAAFVENNTAHAVPLLLEALESRGLRPDQVDYAIVTHIHLDHAGGSSALLKACPNAKLLCHPKAARHLIDPSRLVESSMAVYGEEQFRKLYGEIRPIPEKRVEIMEDNAALDWGSRRFTFLHTRGHADHHFVIYDSASDGVFTGDSFGIAYPVLQHPDAPFLFPSTSPTQFRPEDARNSVRRIRETGTSRAFLTHFGEFTHMAEGVAQLMAGIDVHEQILHDAIRADASGEALVDFCRERVRGYFETKMRDQGQNFTSKQWKYLEMDVDLNAQGIAFVAEKERKKARG